jgi:4-amino-4-deoxy-L-arabinose transferase-like glycosyltransferase
LLGANSIWDANEAFYVETPRQMVLSGDYISPSFNGQPRFNKPVLSYWIVAGAYRVFGESVTVERACIAFGAMGLILATFLAGRALRSTSTGVMAALFLASSPRVVIYARRIFIDVYVTMFMALALACFAMAERFPAHRRRWLLLMYAAIGLGVLTKGPVYLVLPAAAGIIWLAVERRLADVRRLMLVPGMLIIAAVVIPWYASVYAAHGWTHIRQFLFDENIGRYLSPMAQGDRGVTFYFKVLFGDLFPWAPLVAVPLVMIVIDWRRRMTSPDGSSDAIRRLLWVWIAVFVGVFSFSQTKQDLYIFPVAPAVAALVADALASAEAGRARGAIGALFLGVGSACVLVGAGTYWYFGPPARAMALAGAGAFAIVLTAAGLAALVLWLTARRRTAVLALATGFVLLNYVLVARILPDIERFKPVPPLAKTLNERASPHAVIGFDAMALPSFVYYTKRSIEDVGTLESAAAFLGSPLETWVIAGEAEWAELKPRVPGACVADRRPLFLFDTKFSNILNGVPPPDVLLLTNRCGSGR